MRVEGTVMLCYSHRAKGREGGGKGSEGTKLRGRGSISHYARLAVEGSRRGGRMR